MIKLNWQRRGDRRSIVRMRRHKAGRRQHGELLGASDELASMGQGATRTGGCGRAKRAPLRPSHTEDSIAMFLDGGEDAR